MPRQEETDRIASLAKTTAANESTTADKHAAVALAVSAGFAACAGANDEGAKAARKFSDAPWHNEPPWKRQRNRHP